MCRPPAMCMVLPHTCIMGASDPCSRSPAQMPAVASCSTFQQLLGLSSQGMCCGLVWWMRCKCWQGCPLLCPAMSPKLHGTSGCTVVLPWQAWVSAGASAQHADASAHACQEVPHLQHVVRAVHGCTQGICLPHVLLPGRRSSWLTWCVWFGSAVQRYLVQQCM
jgi:hypothetical protein